MIVATQPPIHPRGNPAPTPRPRRVFWIALTLAWAVTVTALGVRLLAYAGSPGPVGSPPIDWPRDSRVLAPRDRPELIVFLHPHCPCSHATLANLLRVQARCRERLGIQIALVVPPGAPPGWVDTPLRRAVLAATDLRVITDVDGAEARRFGALTSGQCYLYDVHCRLVFQGGLTPARGHEGDCVGTDAVIDVAFGRMPRTATAPVTGCHLFDDDQATNAPEPAPSGVKD